MTKPKPNRGSTLNPDHIMLSIFGDAKTSMAVTWRTCTDVTEGYVLYEDANGAQVRVDAVCRTIESDIDVSHFYTAQLTDLAPGTRYSYTVGSDAHRSKVFSFETEPENLEQFTFLVISDHQKGAPHEAPDYSRVRRLLQMAIQKYPDTRFILTAGDNCDNGQNELQWNGMFTGMTDVIESYPYMMSTGNHDNRGFVSLLPEPVGKFYLDHADFFDEQFALAYPQNGPKGFETENYSFDYGNVHFTVMGINAPEAVENWAYEDIKSSSKTWKLGTYHFPIYPAMPEGQNDDAYPWLRKPIEQGRLDLLFSGHEHGFTRTYPTKDDELFDRPSQGTVFYTVGNGNGNIHCTVAKKVWQAAFYPQEEDVAMVCVCEVKGDKLTITALLDDGRIADIFVLDKENDSIYPPALPPVYHKPKMAFKGDLVELGARDVPPMEKDGIWCIPVALLIGAIGGMVEKTPGTVKCHAYKCTLEIHEDSDIALTSHGSHKMRLPAFRGAKGQLYIPAEDCCEIFGMKYQYAARNNYLNFDHASEDKSVSEQP